MIRLLIPILILWALGMITWKMYQRSTDDAKLSRKERAQANKVLAQKAQVELQQQELAEALELVAQTSADPDTQLMARHALSKIKQENERS